MLSLLWVGAYCEAPTIKSLEHLLEQLSGVTLPTIQADLAKKEQVARVESFKGGAFPQISLSSGLTYADNSTKALLSGFPMAGGGTADRMRGLNYQWSVQLMQTLNVARIGLVLKMADTQAETIALQHRWQKDQIMVQGVSLYAQALLTAKELELAKAKDRRMQEMLRFVETEARFGGASGAHLKMVRSEAVLASIAVLQIENTVENQKTDLLRMLPDDASVELKPQIQDYSFWQESHSDGVAVALQLKEQEVVFDKQLAQYERSKLFPTLAFVSSLGPQYFASEDHKKFSKAVNAFDPAYWDLRVGIQLNWSLWDGGTLREGAREAAYRTERRSVELEEFRRQILAEQEKARRNYNSAKKEFHAYEVALNATKELLEQSEKDFLAGRIALQEWLDQQTQWFEISLGQYQAHIRMVIAALQERVATGAKLYE